MFWTPLLATALAVLILVVPGLVVAAPLRGGLIPRLAVGSIGAVASIGVAGVVFGAAGIRFQAWQPLVTAFVFAVGVWLGARRWTYVRLRRYDHRFAVVATWLGAWALLAAVLLAGLPGFDHISQTYDNIFHLSAIASILQDGDASSLTLRTIIDPGRSFAYYPSAWHSAVALVVQFTGVDIATAVNATWLAVVAVVWLPGVAWLAQVCLHRRPPALVALVALPLGAVFGWMPYGLLTWGTLYPNFLATALLPAAVAIPVATWIRLKNPHARFRIVIVGGAATSTALLAIAFAQPRVLASWVLIIAIPAIGIGATSIRRLWHRGGRARTRMLWSLLGVAFIGLILVGVAFAYLVFGLGLFDRPLAERFGGPQAAATQSVLAGLWQVVSVSTLTGTGGVTWPSLLLGTVVIVGAVAAVRVRSLRWIVYVYAVIGIFYAIAAGSDSVFAKLLTGIWYKDRYRLSATLPVLGVVLATLGVLVIAAALRRRGSQVVLATVLAWTVALVSVVTLTATGMVDAISRVFALPPTTSQSPLVSSREVAFLERLDDIVPAGQRVLGDPWDGSTLTWIFSGREPVFPHVNGLWDADRQTLASRLTAIKDDPQVCAALDRLRVRYVMFNPHEFGGGDPSGNHFAAVHQTVEAGFFAAVATDGDSTLYRIDQCGPLR